MWLAFVAVAAAGENLIANGSFEEQGPNGALHWSFTEGARTAGATGATSEVSWPTVDGSVVLQLHGTPSTRSWTAVIANPIPVAAGDEVVLSARMKNEAVRREGNQFDNCYIGVELLDANGKRVDARPMSLPDGDHAWTEQRIRFRVPDRATQARVTAFLSKSGTVWFDDIALETLHWTTARSEHFDFYWFPEAPISDSTQRENEKDLAHASRILGVTPPAIRIAFYRYASKEQKGELTGNSGNGHVQGTAVHSLFATQEHELVHILTQPWGTPDTALLGEGIAVYVGGQWQNRPIDDYARELLAAGKIPPLRSLVAMNDFRAHDSLITYAIAGSFVGYLVRLKDMDAFKRVYVAGAPFEQRLKSEYGKDLATLDADWRAALAKR